MSLRNKWTMGILSLGAAIILGASATTLYAQAQTPEESESETVTTETRQWDPIAALAEALGITVEELEAAQAEVHDAAIDHAVEEGLISQEEADLLKAQERVREYLQDRMQTMYEDTIAQAVKDGAITQEQADLLLSQEDHLGRGGFFGVPGIRIERFGDERFGPFIGRSLGGGRLEHWRFGDGPMDGSDWLFRWHGGMHESIPALPITPNRQ